MTKGSDVLLMLLPEGGWLIRGDDYENIEFIDVEPITKADFEAGFAKVDAWKAERQAALEATKQAALDKLVALGLDLDDLSALGF